MEIIRYQDLKLSNHAEASEIVKPLEKIFRTEYGCDEWEASRGQDWVEGNLKRAMHLSDNLEDALIVDLGCGVKNNKDCILGHRDFEPWICRGFHHLGYKIIGADIQDNSDEIFENYCIDLYIEKNWVFLEDNSVDLFLANNFFDSPTLWQRLGDENLPKFKSKIFSMAEKKSKPESKFVYF